MTRIILRKLNMKKEMDKNNGVLDMVHISYKSEDCKHIEKICRAMDANGIEYSIDKKDILYRDSIEEYEKRIGQANRVIVFVTNDYLKSIHCMYEMAHIIANKNLSRRLLPIVDIKDISRDGDGLAKIKEYWQAVKNRKIDQMKTESGSTEYLNEELRKINMIIQCLDELWRYISDTNTSSLENLLSNNASILISEIKKNLNQKVVPELSQVDLSCTVTPPSTINEPSTRSIFQLGDKSIYIEKNEGDINIS